MIVQTTEGTGASGLTLTSAGYTYKFKTAVSVVEIEGNGAFVVGINQELEGSTRNYTADGVGWNSTSKPRGFSVVKAADAPSVGVIVRSGVCKFDCYGGDEVGLHPIRCIWIKPVASNVTVHLRVTGF